MKTGYQTTTLKPIAHAINMAFFAVALLLPVMTYAQESNITYDYRKYALIRGSESKWYTYYGDYDSWSEYSCQTDNAGYRYANGYLINAPSDRLDDFHLPDEIFYKYDGGNYRFRTTIIADNVFKGKTLTLSPSSNGYLTIPKYVRIIGRHSFEGCTGFTNLKFSGRDVREIRENAFAGCSNLERLSAPSSVKIIGEEAFSNCRGLKEVILYDVDSIGSGAFMNCSSLERLDISECRYIGQAAFAFTGLKSMVLSDRLKHIDASAFWGCGFRGQLKLPDSVEFIGTNAFFDCQFIGLHLPSELKYLDNDAFRECKGVIGSLVIPDKVEAIGYQAFQGCSNISGSLTIGKNVDRIGSKAFWKIGKINKVIVKAERPPKIVGGDLFMDEIYDNAVLVVAPGLKDTHASAEYWSKFATIVDEDDDESKIYPESFDLYVGKLKIEEENTSSYDVPGPIVLPIGESRSVEAKIYPETATETKLFWISDNPDIATVDNGVVTAVSKGRSTIYGFTENGLRRRVGVAAGEAPIEKIEFTADTIELEIRDDYKLNEYNLLDYLTISPDNPYRNRYKGIDYDDSIISLDTYYLKSLTILKVGETKLTIMAEDGYGACDSCIVKVVAPSVKSVEMNKRRISGVKIGDQVQLKAGVWPLNSNRSITWSSDDESVALVDTTGLVSIVGYGDTYIHAVSIENPAIKDSCEVYSHGYKVNVEIDNPKYYGNYSFEVGDTIYAHLEIDPENLPIYDIEWSSDNKISIIDNQQDKAIFKATNTVYRTSIRCSYKIMGYNSTNLKAGSKDIHVELPKSIVLEKDSYTLNEGESVSLKATTSPENAWIKTITWSSSDNSVATVYSNGEVHAKKNGTATITAKYGNASATCLITVKDILVESLTLTPSEWVGNPWDEFIIDAEILPENAKNKTLKWETSNEQVAVLYNNGHGRIMDNGYSIITASTTDGSDLHAECIISTPTGIDNVITDDTGDYDIYTASGLLLKTGCNAEDVKRLGGGVYILAHNGIARKIVILQ